MLCLSSFKLEDGLRLVDIAEKCPMNLTGADLHALCCDAMLNAVRRKIRLIESGMDVICTCTFYD